MASTMRPFQSIVTLRTIVVAGGAVFAGLVLLYFGGRDSLWKHHQGLQALVTGLGALFIVSIGLSLFWELAARRSFAREILEAARTSTEVDSAGLAGIGTNYLENVDWAGLFAGARNLDISSHTEIPGGLLISTGCRSSPSSTVPGSTSTCPTRPKPSAWSASGSGSARPRTRSPGS